MTTPSYTKNLNMNTKSSKEQTRSKRPLSEISPNLRRDPLKKRRNSLGFEMASIPSNSIKSFPSRIPPPTASKSATIASSSSSSSSSSMSSLSSIPQGILSIQERLRRKASVNDNNGQSSSSFAARPQSTVSRSNELQEEYYSLNELYKQQASSYEKLEVELGKLKEIYKNYYYKIDLINDLVHQKQSEFEILEHDIINDVEQEEKLTYSKLHENKIKLDGQFKELEFEMLNQLEDAKQFDFKELLTKIESLKTEKMTVLSEYEKVMSEVNAKLNAEREQFSKDLEDKLHPLNKNKQLINDQLINKKDELTKLETNYNELKDQLAERNDSIDSIKHEIANIEQEMNNYQATRKNLELKLSEAESELHEALAKDKQEQREYDNVRSEYSVLHSKIAKHDEHRRILENSIMKIQGKFRVYAIGEDLDTYNKCFAKDTPSSFIIDEFQCLVQSTLKGHNVAIINNYLRGSQIVIDSYKNIQRQQKYIYQCISIKNGDKNTDICDLLNSNAPVDSLFQHQQMVIDDFDQFKQIVKKIDATLSQEIAIHIISTDKSKLMIIDCSRIDPDQQDKILEKFKSNSSLGFLEKLLTWIYHNCSTLFLYEPKTSQSNSLLKFINSIDSPI
ncbi:hypothetical protein MEM_02773 [Candida albicans L26]|uniref:Spindle pole body-associated protein Vik1/Cik1 microtubule binding domain-containing protein n=1 Tax=Candida albicans P78048 TaxID=1094989 RepID=A0AB34PT39_CANAX|nr:hypothetical protein MG3_02783 [Candida albicans P78048]KGR17427.1 hypothetical protein MG9_02777 [Candida albicans P37037]KGU11953.1 hypothetical protein MEY_02736 [Candida albicans 19F]KGU12789.1 hypothetical protein MEM_02773 [Candida albicans L26]KGU31874.1 hypothetical protein MGK_02764 [Candida albicans P57055]KHC78488.1 hypothetical protein MGS_02763 [Candida albicans P78042]RLP64000.1 hypothetical protein L150_02736 [Candida albicans Ca529L]